MELKELRKSLHIKQTHAAQICRTTQSAYSKVESGKHPWRADEFKGHLWREMASSSIRLTIEKQGI